MENTNLLTLDDIKKMSFKTIKPNQYIFKLKDCEMFYSYQSVIAIKFYDGQTVLDRHYWDYSRTTGKYRNQFLNETKRETEKKINNGTYQLKELN